MTDLLTVIGKIIDNKKKANIDPAIALDKEIIAETGMSWQDIENELKQNEKIHIGDYINGKYCDYNRTTNVVREKGNKLD